MTTSTFFIVVLSLLTVSHQLHIQHPNYDGISSLCQKCRIWKLWCPPIPSECCRDRGRCPRYIKANSTGYGIRNPEIEWQIRDCDCDIDFWNCATKELSNFQKNRARSFTFSGEKCFKTKLQLDKGKFVPVTEIFEVTSWIPW